MSSITHEAIAVAANNAPVLIPSVLHLIAVSVPSRRRLKTLYEAFFLSALNFYVWAIIELSGGEFTDGVKWHLMGFVIVMLFQVGLFFVCASLVASVRWPEEANPSRWSRVKSPAVYGLAYGLGFFSWYATFPIYRGCVDSGIFEAICK